MLEFCVAVASSYLLLVAFLWAITDDRVIIQKHCSCGGELLPMENYALLECSKCKQRFGYDDVK